MTDVEPRRSGRKTKGQHTRNSEAHELIAPPAPKATPRRKPTAVKQPTPAASSPAVSTPQSPGSEDEDTDEDDDPNAQIRCACGAVKDVKGDPRMMVQCEGCKVWQHCECLDLNEDELDDKDKLYYCEICKPELHTEFFAKIEKGELPWETAKKNRGKKKRGSRRSTGGRSRATRARQKKKTTKKPEPEADADADAEGTAADQPENESAKDSQEDGSEVPQDKKNVDAEPQDEVMGEASTEEQNGGDESVEKDEQEIGHDVKLEESNEGDQKVAEVQAKEEPQQTDQPSKLEPDETDKGLQQDEQEDEKMEICEEPTEMNESEKELSPHTSMPPPIIPPIQTTLPLDKKGDEAMKDAPARGTSTTPTTPTISKKRDVKRKVSAADSVRSVRRKTTHDSDDDYNSDSDSGPTKHRRASASSAVTATTTKEAPKEVKPTPLPPRRVSVTKPMKRASVPDDLSVQLELVEKTDDLRNNARRNIVNFFSPIVQTVIEKNASILTPVQKEEEYAEKLALEIEHHLYLELWNQHSQPTSQYKLKARGIGLNLPKNPLLQSRLLKGEVTPERLVQMKPEEMASKEFQLLAEQVRRESELQNTIVAEETGPRIRRTHKGEEIVGDDIDHSNGSDEPVYSASRGTTDHVMEDPPSAQRSRAGTPSIEDSHMSPPQTAQAYNEDASHSGSAPQTPRTPVSAKTPINSGRQFSMENVWSNINTPENDHIQRPASRPPPPQLLSIRQQPKLAIDADIDKLLAEEDHDMENETPPYSPSELTFSDTVVPVWRGRFSMVLVANFSARANYLGGPQNAHHTLPLNDLLASIVQVDGRIAIDRATEYLCGQKFSSTNEIVVLSIEPEDNLESTALGEFNKLFNYFQRKERYGVIGKPPHKAVKDCYVVPIDTRDDMPDFFETLPNHLLEQSPRKKRVFAVVFVLSKIALAEERSLREGTTGTGKSALSSPRVTPGTALSPHAHMSLQQQNIQPVFAAATQQYHHPSASPQQPLPPLPPPPHNQNHQGYPPQQQQQQFSGGYAGNGYGYYPQQQQQQQQPPHPPPQQQPPVKKFTFTPWKELEEVLPHLTLEQVNRINQAVAINPAAQTDPSLLAQLIKDQ